MNFLHAQMEKISPFTAGCILFIFLTGFFFVQDEVSFSGNAASRFAAVQALTEQHTFAIDQTDFYTFDKGKINGRTYSDKPYLTALLGTAAAVPLHLCGMTFAKDRSSLIFLVNFIAFYSGLILFFLLFRVLLRKKTSLSETELDLFSLLFVFGTLIFSYSVSINNHTPAALMILVILFLFHCPRTVLHCILIGLSAGLLFDFDFLFGGCFGIGCFLLMLFPKGRETDLKSAFFYAAAAVPAVCITFLLNRIAYGSFLPLYLLQTHTVGEISARAVSIPEYVCNSLFGFKGFFCYMPVLLFGIPALFQGKDRIKTVMLLSVFAAMGYYCYATQNYGGWCYGMRYFIPGIPVLFYYGTLWVLGTQKKIWKLLFASGAAAGIAVSLLGAYDPWCISWDPSQPNDSWKCLRNSVESNFLRAGFHYAPDSPLVRYLIEKKYGLNDARIFLFVSYTCMKQFGIAENLLKRYPDQKLILVLQQLISEEISLQKRNQQKPQER